MSFLELQTVLNQNARTCILKISHMELSQVEHLQTLLTAPWEHFRKDSIKPPWRKMLYFPGKTSKCGTCGTYFSTHYIYKEIYALHTYYYNIG